MESFLDYPTFGFGCKRIVHRRVRFNSNTFDGCPVFVVKKFCDRAQVLLPQQLSEVQVVMHQESMFRKAWTMMIRQQQKDISSEQTPVYMAK